ncbi:hypothetical protein [Acinetobacter sp. ANC 4178]|uniref:hypothetical protein n=1 Tax=Acinetobacter sp. ANC 4178 TaxID=2529839 RepID=UPI00103EF18D|nr:hypothetical protein [Acinetobacter sp. ANC 4178]TCB67508.1 hypothetical protein E0H87_04740 [Acinetobacter sp. ANC 4178]
MNTEAGTIIRLERSLGNLLLSLAGVSGYNEIKDQIIGVNRKLRITRELEHTRYVAVAGTQSAGKTRLIREIYNLDDTWLSDNEGRGEQLPVFILESKTCTQPFAVKVEFDEKSGSDKEVKIEPEEFQQILRNYNADNTILLVKLYVPSKHFKGEELGFVLLPGYELETRENKKWQELMRHTLIHALGCILVTDETRIAANSSQKILNDLRSKYLEYRQPVIAVTKTENLQDEQRQELQKTVAEVFQFNEQQRANIVLTGANNHEYKSRWESALIFAVLSTTHNSRESELAKYNEFDDILSIELEKIVDKVDSSLRESGVSAIGQEKTVEEIILKFDEARDRFKKAYSKKITFQTQEYVKTAIESAEKLYKKDEEGLGNWLKNTANTLIQNSDTSRHKQRIRQIWLENHNIESSEPRTIIESNLLALSSLSKDQLGLELDLKFERDGALMINHQKLLGNASSDKVNIFDRPEIKEGLSLLFRPNLNLSEDKKIQFDENSNLPKAIALVPAVVMEYARIMQIATVITPNINIEQGMTATQLIENIAKSTSEGLPKFQESLQPVVRTLAAIFAVDVAADGQIDTIPALIDAISGSASTVTSGIGSTVSIAAAGVIIAGYLAYQIGKETENYHNSQKEYIAAVLGHYGDANVQKALEHYDDVMENIRDVIFNNLNKAYGIDKGLLKKDTIYRSLNAVKNSQENLQRLLGGKQSRLA